MVVAFLGVFYVILKKACGVPSDAHSATGCHLTAASATALCCAGAQVRCQVQGAGAGCAGGRGVVILLVELEWWGLSGRASWAA